MKHFLSARKNNVMCGLVGLNKQTWYLSLTYFAKNVTYFLCGKTSISFLFYSAIYPTAASGSDWNKHQMYQWFTCCSSCTDMIVNASIWMSFSRIFFCNCTALPGFRPPSNHLFISLMTSKLIYKTVIYIAKNEVSIAGFLSVLTVGDMSSVSPGSDGPPAATCLMGTCHHPSELMLSVCWSHSLFWCGLCDGAAVSK